VREPVVVKGADAESVGSFSLRRVSDGTRARRELTFLESALKPDGSGGAVSVGGGGTGARQIALPSVLIKTPQPPA